MNTPLFDANMQTIAWFKQQYDAGALELRPPYQRKPVWSARNKCNLIETILMGWPVPEIYVQATPSASGDMTYAIVDGQQRIRTVLQFIGLEQEDAEQHWNKFSLDKLKDDSPFYDLEFEKMKDREKKALFAYRFTVSWLNTDDDNLVRSMFIRLNKFSMPLKPQELRNSMFQGPFLKLSELLADDEYWATNRIVSPANIRRMGDIEFVSDLLIGVIHGPQGGGPKIIDDYYQKYEDFDEEFPEQALARETFTRAWTLVKEALPDIAATRWRNKNDFYTLFVALSARLATQSFKAEHLPELTKALTSFAGQIDDLRKGALSKAGKNARQYFDAVEKGANEKSRRGERHNILLELLDDRWFGGPGRPRRPKSNRLSKLP